jgi:outer membrane biogenesis lipoprotein LolB
LIALACLLVQARRAWHMESTRASLLLTGCCSQMGERERERERERKREREREREREKEREKKRESG